MEGSFYDSIPRIPITSKEIFELLRKGKFNAVRSDTIAKMYNMDDGRTNVKVRKIIKRAIEEGYPIGSCSKGYYIIDSPQEKAECIQTLEGRRTGLDHRIALLKRNCTDPGNQLPLL